MLKKFVLKIIRFYQKYLSLDQGFLHRIFKIRICRFTPTCSEYAFQSVEKYGILKGGMFALKRIFRCGPWHPGGHDPVP